MSGRFVFLAEDYDEIYRKCKDAEQSYRNGKFDDCREQTCNLIKDIFANMGMTLFEALNIKKYDYISDSLKSIIYLSNSKQQVNEQVAKEALDSLFNIMIWFVICIENRDYRDGLFLPDDLMLVKKHLKNRSLFQTEEKNKSESKYDTLKSDEQIIKEVVVDTIHKKNNKNAFITKYGRNIVFSLIFLIVVGVGVILLGFHRDKVVKQEMPSLKYITQDNNTEIAQTSTTKKNTNDKTQVINYQNMPNSGFKEGLLDPFKLRENIVSLNLKRSNIVKVDTFNPNNEYEKLALQGYANAQYYLAFCYLVGYRINQDINKAVFWYEHASNQGLYEATWILNEIKKGNTSKLLKKKDCPCYMINIPDKADEHYGKYYLLKNEREILLRQCVAQNNTLLAIKRQLTFNGEKIDTELEKNIKEVQKSLNLLKGDWQKSMNENLLEAADQGHYYAQYLVGQEYNRAFTLSRYKDIEKGKKAFEYLKKSSDSGFYYAMDELAPMYNSLAFQLNNIVEKDVGLSNKLKQKAKRLENQCKNECFDLHTIRSINIKRY